MSLKVVKIWSSVSSVQNDCINALEVKTRLNVVDNDRCTVRLRVGDAHLGDGDEATVGCDRQGGDGARVFRPHDDFLLPLVDIVGDETRPGRVDDCLVVGVRQRARKARHASTEHVTWRRQ